MASFCDFSSPESSVLLVNFSALDDTKSSVHLIDYSDVNPSCSDESSALIINYSDVSDDSSAQIIDDTDVQPSPVTDSAESTISFDPGLWESPVHTRTGPLHSTPAVRNSIHNPPKVAEDNHCTERTTVPGTKRRLEFTAKSGADAKKHRARAEHCFQCDSKTNPSTPKASDAMATCSTNATATCSMNTTATCSMSTTANQSICSSSSNFTDCIQSGGLSWDFLTTLKINGCQEQCATEQHHLHPIDILSYHNHFTQLPRPARRQWVLDYLNTHSSHDTSSGEPVTIYLIGGKPVCRPLWIATLGISNSLYYEVRKLFQNGHVRITKEIQRAPLQRTSEAIAWMDTFFNLIGDHMPHRIAVHLPSSLSKSAVYQRMVAEMTGRSKDSIISLPQFFKVWDEHFRQVTIPKESRFTKCDTCTMIKREKEKTFNEVKLKELDRMLQEHNALQMDQRQRYHRIRERAECDPSMLSLIIDGMDQNKTNVPHLKRVEKSAANLWHMRTHLTGVLLHGNGATAYFDLHQWPHDPNLTLNVLLLELKAKFRQIVEGGGRLPIKLFLQLDNCARENKNQHVLTFISLLVELRMFDEVQVGFLMKGHTHEDVDALFGNIRSWLQKHDARTLNALMDGCKQANKSVRDVVLLKEMYDVKDWLTPAMQQLHNHSNPHIFRFIRGSDGHCQMFYKHWNHEEWEPNGQPGLQLLKGMPEGMPKLVLPNGTKLDLPTMKKDITRYAALSTVDQQWWKDFLARLENSIANEPEVPESWPMEFLLGISRHHPRTTTEVDPVPEQLQNMRSAETREIPELYTGRWQKSKTATAKKKQSTQTADGTVTQKSNGETTVTKEALNSRGKSARTPANKDPGVDKSHRDTAAKTKAHKARGAKSHREPPQSETHSIQPGDFVAISHPQWKPLIGEVKEVHEKTFTVLWWSGTYSGKWKVSRRREGRSMVDWVEKLEYDQILLTFQWNKKDTMRLPQKLRETLKKAYAT